MLAELLRRLFPKFDPARRLRCTEIKEGDILVSRLPDPVGRACVIPSLDAKSITAVDCTIIRLDRNVLNANFLNYYFQSQQYFEQVKKNNFVSCGMICATFEKINQV